MSEISDLNLLPRHYGVNVALDLDPGNILVFDWDCDNFYLLGTDGHWHSVPGHGCALVLSRETLGCDAGLKFLYHGKVFVETLNWIVGRICNREIRYVCG